MLERLLAQSRRMLLHFSDSLPYVMHLQLGSDALEMRCVQFKAIARVCQDIAHLGF